jgi:hypothetical protein
MKAFRECDLVRDVARSDWWLALKLLFVSVRKANSILLFISISLSLLYSVPSLSDLSVSYCFGL